MDLKIKRKKLNKIYIKKKKIFFWIKKIKKYKNKSVVYLRQILILCLQIREDSNRTLFSTLDSCYVKIIWGISALTKIKPNI